MYYSVHYVNLFKLYQILGEFINICVKFTKLSSETQPRNHVFSFWPPRGGVGETPSFQLFRIRLIKKTLLHTKCEQCYLTE